MRRLVGSRLAHYQIQVKRRYVGVIVNAIRFSEILKKRSLNRYDPRFDFSVARVTQGYKVRRMICCLIVPVKFSYFGYVVNIQRLLVSTPFALLPTVLARVFVTLSDFRSHSLPIRAIINRLPSFPEPVIFSAIRLRELFASALIGATSQNRAAWGDFKYFLAYRASLLNLVNPKRISFASALLANSLIHALLGAVSRLTSIRSIGPKCNRFVLVAACFTNQGDTARSLPVFVAGTGAIFSFSGGPNRKGVVAMGADENDFCHLYTSRRICSIFNEGSWPRNQLCQRMISTLEPYNYYTIRLVYE